MRNIILLVIAVVSIGLQSCELSPREIELAAHDSKLAITAMLSPGDTTANILFNVSIGILDTLEKYEGGFLENQKLTLHTPDAGPVNGYISKDIDDYKEWETSRKYRIWKFDYNDFKVGATYELEASADNYQPITAKTTVPSTPNVIDVKITAREPVNGQYFVRDKFDIVIKDDPDERNFYKINAIPISLTEFPYLNPYIFYRNANDPIDLSALDERIIVISDDEFNGQEYTIVLYGEIRGQRDNYRQIDFSLVSITEQEYRREIALERSGDDNPFAEPVIYNSNIENGYGVFSISSPPYREAVDLE